MRVHAISDLHVDFPANREWLQSLSDHEFTEDAVILAGDICESMQLLRETLERFLERFRLVCFVPGNHELWVRDAEFHCSLEKFEAVREMCRSLGVLVDPYREGELSLVPLFGWYDYSFAEPDRKLRRAWRDYRACSWPLALEGNLEVNRHFLSLNETALQEVNRTVISYSHFVPRIDLMPARIPQQRRNVYPVLGSAALGDQVARLRPDIHVYGHSHVNQSMRIDGIHYINNAFGYPSEFRIASKRLRCIFSEDPL